LFSGNGGTHPENSRCDENGFDVKIINNVMIQYFLKKLIH
jgi:hypothetical protein